MRPIKLNITAFGSYAGENIIDFNKLGTDGLYLITGVTGAGKSTIFDAVTYALYGGLSEKSDKMLRSEYADPGVDTVVELEFEYKGKNYTVRRNPAYKRQNKRGGDPVKRPAGAALTLPDGKVIEKSTQVDAEIKRILGITKEQFKQTVMIEQGKFRELLTADTKARKEILRSIFNIYVYNDFQERIGTRAAVVKSEFEKQLRELAGISESIKCDEDGELSVLRDKAVKGELSVLSELAASLKKQNSEDNSRLENLNEAQKKIGAKILEVNELITKGNAQIKRRNELKAALEKLPEIQKNSEEKSTEARLIEEKNSSENDKLNKDIGALENDLPKYKSLEIQRQNLGMIEKRISNNTAAKDSIVSCLNVLQEEQKRLLEESAGLESAGENIAKLNADIKECEQRSKSLSELKNELRALKTAQNEYSALQEKYLAARSNSDKLQTLALDKRRSFNDEQAGILAETLHNNEPCPVCGSVDHPKPAQKTAGAPSKEEVEAAEAKAETARINTDKISSDCNAKKSVIKEKERGITNKISELLPGSTLDNADENADNELAVIGKSIKAFTEKLSAENKKLKRKNELSELIPKKQAEIDKSNKDINDLTTAIANDSGSKDQLQEQVDNDSKQLNFPNVAEAEACIAELRDRIGKNKAAIDSAKKAAEGCDQKLKNITAEIEAHKKELSFGEPIDVEEKEREMKRLKDEEARANEKILEIMLRHNENENAAEKLAVISGRVIEADRENTFIQSLADTARGKLSGGVKIDLESFVQTRFLDSILHSANRHLHKMSNGQYELIRKKNIDTAQGQHTLDLNVKDYYNGTQRDVKSLSGGESFLASLSLALGLSDTVQQRGGGVRLETMFIDEGFGSLSPEYLDRAMGVLRSLTESDRLIGIISHVEEIKRLIPKRIEITKDGSKGSKAKIVV